MEKNQIAQWLARVAVTARTQATALWQFKVFLFCKHNSTQPFDYFCVLDNILNEIHLTK